MFLPLTIFLSLCVLEISKVGLRICAVDDTEYSQTASLLPALEGATGRYLRGFRVSLTSDRHFNFEFLFSFRCLFTSGLTRAVLSPDAVIYSDVVQRPFNPS